MAPKEKARRGSGPETEPMMQHNTTTSTLITLKIALVWLTGQHVLPWFLVATIFKQIPKLREL